MLSLYFINQSQNPKYTLQRDNKSPSTLDTALFLFSPQTSRTTLEPISTRFQITTTWVALQWHSAGRRFEVLTQWAHSLPGQKIPFQHRCHLSSHMQDAQERRSNNKIRIFLAAFSQTWFRYVCSRREREREKTTTVKWNEMKQLSGLNHEIEVRFIKGHSREPVSVFRLITVFHDYIHRRTLCWQR